MPITILKNLHMKAHFLNESSRKHAYQHIQSAPKNNKPKKAVMCIKSFSLAGIKKDKNPKIEIGAPNMAGI